MSLAEVRMKIELSCFFAIGCALLVLAVADLHGSSHASEQFSVPQDESQQLEGYLRKLQLDQLLIEHLEFQTARQTDRISRQSMAARLTELYSEKMMADDDAETSVWRLKTERLLSTYPDLATPSIRIAMLQSKYLQGESEFRKWWIDGRPEHQQGTLVDHWRELKSELTALHRQLESDYDDQASLLKTISKNQDIASRRLMQTESLLLHANYLLGWSAYFQGILAPELRGESMLQADQYFREFLQIDPQIILNEVSSKWIDFSSDWNARALVGLAMSQRGLNRVEQSAYCFDLLEKHSPNPQTRNLRYVWDLNARIYLNEFSAAQELVASVQKKTNETAQLSETGRIAFWMASLHGGAAIRNQASLIAARLIRAGLNGLARDFQAPLIEKFLSENNFQIPPDDFLGAWISGYLELHRAEQSGRLTSYQLAEQNLQQALAFATESTAKSDLARCRFLLARIDLQQRELQAAADAFLEVAAETDELSPDLAAEAQWLAVRSLSELSRTNPRFTIAANREINQLLRRFPGSIFAKRAEFEKTKISIASLTPDLAVQKLAEIDVDNPNYRLALNEITTVQYQAWLNSHQARRADEPQNLAALLKAESDLRQHAPPSPSIAKAMMLVVDAILRTRDADLDDARQRLDSIQSIISDQGTAYMEYRYYEFQYALRRGQSEQAGMEAEWLSKNARGTRFESSALIQLAQAADQKLKSTTEPTAVQLDEVINVFERLVGLLGHSESVLKNQSNARVAYLRLAELKLNVGKNEEAIDMLETVNQVIPNHKSYLKKLAQAYSESQRFDRATVIWRRLASGLPPGSELWFEAKYELASSLFRIGKKTEAQQVVDQTVLLGAEMPKNWQTLFDTLNEQLKFN